MSLKIYFGVEKTPNLPKDAHLQYVQKARNEVQKNLEKDFVAP
ncbi:MAG: hypothetical protein ACI870_000496 [Crocinitomicaceae bacterium]|jgi:hypothetical protein